VSLSEGTTGEGGEGKSDREWKYWSIASVYEDDITQCSVSFK
jgi:hypothetical protein